MLGSHPDLPDWNFWGGWASINFYKNSTPLILMHRRWRNHGIKLTFLVWVYSQSYFSVPEFRCFFRYMSEVCGPELVDSYRFFMWSWSGGSKADTWCWVVITVKNARNSSPLEIPVTCAMYTFLVTTFKVEMGEINFNNYFCIAFHFIT